MAKQRILVVDDEPRYVRLVKFNLETEGYHILPASRASEALDLLAREEVDLLILDVRMPEMDGFQLLERIREFSMVPVIMLTARGEEQDKVTGLRLGADDYITKPFSAMELVARVEAVLRRARLPAEPKGPPEVSCGPLTLDFVQRRVTRQGEEVKLSPTEYRLLACLASNHGRVMVQEELLERVWGPEYREEYEGLRVYIRRLRQKLEDNPEKPSLILTRPGVGYFLQCPPPGTVTDS